MLKELTLLMAIAMLVQAQQAEHTSQSAVNAIASAPAPSVAPTKETPEPIFEGFKDINLDHDEMLDQIFNNDSLAYARNMSEYLHNQVSDKIEKKKKKLIHEISEKMADLAESVHDQVEDLQYCDWACVESCAVNGTCLKEKAECLESCGCFEPEEPEEEENANATTASSLFSIN